jgi:hypothetical protein
MKTANEMKKMTLTNNTMAKWCETVLAEKIERAAAKGENTIRVNTDDVPDSVRYSRSTVAEFVKKYVSDFGYLVFLVNNNKNIDIQW